MVNFLKETETRYEEFLEAGVECSEESRRRLARIGKAMLHHSEEVRRRKKSEKREEGKRGKRKGKKEKDDVIRMM